MDHLPPLQPCAREDGDDAVQPEQADSSSRDVTTQTDLYLDMLWDQF